MSVGGFVGVMFLVVSVILLGLEWLSRNATGASEGEQTQRREATPPAALIAVGLLCRRLSRRRAWR